MSWSLKAETSAYTQLDVPNVICFLKSLYIFNCLEMNNSVYIFIWILQIYVYLFIFNNVFVQIIHCSIKFTQE